MASNRNTQFEAKGHSSESPLSVTQLNWFLKRLVEEAVPRVWLEGEISDLSRPSSGHIYLTLKDENAQVRAVIWKSTASRMKIQLKDGMSIVCCGGVEIYPPRGSYQIVITQLQPKGVGTLQLALEQLHQKLAKEGLFDPSKKKAIPKYPRRIGFVTSPSGAAIYDFLESAEPLWNEFHLFVIPSRVQGEAASAEIAQGIRLAQRIRPKLDVLVVGRGGGSMEDLWCFNEEIVVRALAECTIPTISAVGHEIDVTLSDLVADARAMTPSQAASLVLPKRTEVVGAIVAMRQRIDALIRNRLNSWTQRVSRLADRPVVSRSSWLYESRKQQIDELEKRLTGSITRLGEFRRQRLQELARATEALSPLGVLERGYSLTTFEGTNKPLQSYREAKIGELLATRLSEGVVVSRVESTNDNSEKNSE